MFLKENMKTIVLLDEQWAVPKIPKTSKDRTKKKLGFETHISKIESAGPEFSNFTRVFFPVVFDDIARTQ